MNNTMLNVSDIIAVTNVSLDGLSEEAQTEVLMGILKNAGRTEVGELIVLRNMDKHVDAILKSIAHRNKQTDAPKVQLTAEQMLMLQENANAI